MGSIREEEDLSKDDNLDLVILGADLKNLHTLIQILIRRVAGKGEHQNRVSQNYLEALSRVIHSEIVHYQCRLLQRASVEPKTVTKTAGGEV